MRRHRAIATTLCVLALSAAYLLAPLSRGAGEVAIVVNKMNPVSDLPLAEVRKIFMGSKTGWPTGKRITLLMAAPGSDERAEILKDVYKMTESEYNKYFLQASFTGQVDAPPRDTSSESELKQIVASNPSAIGYVKATDVDDSVKVVCKVP